SASRPSEGRTMVHQWWAPKSRNESYESSTHFRPRLNHRNGGNFVSPCLGFRNSRAIAGVNVSELNAEKRNENKIVLANWFEFRPVKTGIHATGTSKV